MTDPNLWNQLLVWPILNLLIAFYKLFESIHFPGPLGFSIIALTILMRVFLWPIMSAQMKSAKKMQQLKPHIDELNKKHKDDKQALQKAQMDLYKEHGVNPAMGCLPLIIQMPFLIALYNVFYSVFQVTGANPTEIQNNLNQLITNINQIVYLPALKITNLDLTFFGLNLGLKPSQWQSTGMYFLLAIPLITGLLQYYQTKLMMAQQKSSQKKEIVPAGKNKDVKSEEKNPEDMALEVQKQMAIISPIMFGYFAYQFPIGLALYWNLFGLFGIIQQRLINKRYE